jgi:hypothetical protein
MQVGPFTYLKSYGQRQRVWRYSTGANSEYMRVKKMRVEAKEFRVQSAVYGLLGSVRVPSYVYGRRLDGEIL